MSDKTEKTNLYKIAQRRKDRATEIANTFEWLIIAFILAFVFRAFVMEAFRIPTGSMADTLKGAHFRLRCPQCGYKYDYGFIPQLFGYVREDYRPTNKTLRLYQSRCPSCGHYQPTGGTMPVANGDRILVLKCIYQFVEPKRWDVIVFKNPDKPQINYIKRLVGKPGETIEIMDGDVYIDGQISRKPHKVQKELWMPVYDNDYQPVGPRKPLTPWGFNGHFWQQPFKNTTGSKWIFNNEDKPTKFYLDSPVNEIHSIFYDTSVGNDFRATYAYDDVKEYSYMPYCSDLMVRFCADSMLRQGQIGLELSKYETNYRAWVDFNDEGVMVITKTEKDGKITELARKLIEPPEYHGHLGRGITGWKPVIPMVKFTNVDHQLIFQFGGENLIHDLGLDPNDAGERKTDLQPQVKIFGSGKLALSHIAIFRDIHYTARKFANSPAQGRAIEGSPFILRENEFFVLGDNSPSSEDCRWWSNEGVANRGLTYRAGVVPRDYLVGKALLVYWPQGFKIFARDSLGIVPNIGQMRLIYGGSNENESVTGNW